MASNLQQQSAPLKSNVTPQASQVLENISRALAGLHFGSIEIVVHEGKVTQIERKEKIRL